MHVGDFLSDSSGPEDKAYDADGWVERPPYSIIHAGSKDADQQGYVAPRLKHAPDGLPYVKRYTLVFKEAEWPLRGIFGDERCA